MANQKQENSFQISGKCLEIHPPQYINERLTKRAVVMEVWTGQYANQVIFELKNERGKQLDDLKVGDWIIVTFELSGRKVVRDGQQPRYFNTLNTLTVIKG
jgi:hypothetical protein